MVLTTSSLRGFGCFFDNPAMSERDAVTARLAEAGLEEVAAVMVREMPTAVSDRTAGAAGPATSRKKILVSSKRPELLF